MLVDSIKLRLSEVLNLCCYLKETGEFGKASQLWQLVVDTFKTNTNTSEYTRSKVKHFREMIARLRNGDQLIPFHIDEEMEVIASEMMSRGESYFYLADPEIPFQGGYLICDGSSFNYVDGDSEYFAEFHSYRNARKVSSRFRLPIEDKNRIRKLQRGFGVEFTEEANLFIKGMKFPESQNPFVLGFYTVDINSDEVVFRDIGKANVKVDEEGVLLIPQANTLIELTAASISNKFILVRLSTYRRGYFVSQGSYNLLFKVPSVETNNSEQVFTSGLGFYDDTFDRSLKVEVPINVYQNDIKDLSWLAIDNQTVGIWVRTCLSK